MIIDNCRGLFRRAHKYLITNGLDMVKRPLVICVFFVAGIAAGAESCVYKDSNGTESGQVEGNNESEDSNGPTVFLDCSKGWAKKNPTASFMYFVPLISPTLVDSKTSPNNQQQGGLISCKRKSDSKSFSVSCEFQMQGKGSLKNTFDAVEMIKRNTRDLKAGKPLKNTLDYIKFEGEGYGRIEAKGKIVDSTETVTEVNVHFNSRRQKSPVTIGLYSVKPRNGEYKYENRYNEMVARVNTLTFKKSKKKPKMGIKIASLAHSKEPNGIWGEITATIANLFIKPLEVNKAGNDTMLDFGYALFKEEPTFTFPKAQNLKKEEPKAARTE